MDAVTRLGPMCSALYTERPRLVEMEAYRPAGRPVESENDQSAYVQSFRIEAGAAAGIEPETHRRPLRELLFRVLERQLENDPLNALLFACGFSWRQVNLMMLLRNYLMQAGSVYTKRTINETLVRRPAATCALYALFDAYFKPGLPPVRLCTRIRSLVSTGDQ